MAYRSQLEQRLHTGPLAKLEYEPKDCRLPYTVESTYLPDFVSRRTGVLYEAKGRFRQAAEARKYVCIQAQYPQETLRFVLSNPGVRAYPGTKQSLADWMERHGFEWCVETKIPKSWRT